MDQVILLDVDGVLADFVGGLCRALAPHGHDVLPEDVRAWDLTQALPAPAARCVPKILSNPGFASGLAWYHGAREFLAECRDPWIVTAPYTKSATWVSERLAWLVPAVSPHRVIFADGRAKPRVHGDVLIEDNAETAHAWAARHPEGLALVLARPWNADMQGALNVHRVRDFDEARRAIREMA